MYHFHTSDQRKACAYISNIALTQKVKRYTHCYQCVYLIKHCLNEIYTLLDYELRLSSVYKSGTY